MAIEKYPPPRENDLRTAALYVRSLAPSECRPQQIAIIRRLKQLEASGAINDYSVEVWGSQLTEYEADLTESGDRIRDRIEDFRAWAADHDVSIESFFPIRTVASEFTDEEYTRIQFPVLTLAESGDDSLRFVTPCTDGESVYTVVDHLDLLEDYQSGNTCLANPQRPTDVLTEVSR